VFVPVGEVAECSESEARRVRSIVGLRRTDDCPLTRGDFAEMYPLVRETLASVLNRELDLAAQFLRLGGPEIMTTQLEEQVIKGASKVMNYIPQDNPDSRSPRLWNCCDAKDMITRLHVQLGAELDELGFGNVPENERRDYGLQAIAMITRPLGLGSTPVKVDSHLHLQERKLG